MAHKLVIKKKSVNNTRKERLGKTNEKLGFTVILQIFSYSSVSFHLYLKQIKVKFTFELLEGQNRKKEGYFMLFQMFSWSHS